MQHACI